MEAPAAVGGRALVFIGFMGAGQDDGGARGGRRRSGARAVDSDHLLEARLGQPIEDYFAAHGEAAFRAAGGAGRVRAARRARPGR